MNNILDIVQKLPTITLVSIEASRRMPQLFSLKDLIFHLQMTYYWLKHADMEMKNLTGSEEIISEEEGEHKMIIPTLLGIPEQLEYMQANLKELTQNVWEYMNDTALPDGVKHKVEQSYNNMMMALFNTELSTTYYEQLANQRGPFPGI